MVSYKNMRQDSSKKTPVRRAHLWILVAIMAGGMIFRLIHLGIPDMASDDALYSIRSIGWVDYVAATNRQSTPVTWFAERQWWQGLSFHDAPPLVFAVQRVFFALGGDSVWMARMPFVVAGTALIAVVFLLGEAIAGVSVGLAAAGALAVMNYAVGASRIGFLDGFVALWGALALWFFLKAAARPRYYLGWGFAVALGVLTKYTFFFLAPVFVGATLLWRRDAFRNKWFWLAGAVICLLLAPLVAYNAMMWSWRGHPDAALSTFVGVRPADFYGLDRETHSILEAPRAALKVLIDNFSIAFRLLFLWGLIAAGIRARRGESAPTRRNLLLLGAALISGIAIVSLAGGGDRFGILLVPLIAVILGIGVIEARLYARGRYIWVLAVMIGMAVLWEGAFSAQTQLMARPVLPSPLLVGSNRPPFTGYRLLEDYVADFYRAFPEPSPIVIFKDEPQLAALQKQWIEAKLRGRQNPVFQKHLLVFDDRIGWFAWVWIFERRRLYDSAPIHSIEQFVEKMEESGGAFYTQFGLADATIIVADDSLVRDEGMPADDMRAGLARELATMKRPIDEIRGIDGQILFRVFRISLAPENRD